MKVLSIGNSFSQDSHIYLNKLAKNEGVIIETQNLYIGGCSLQTHYANIESDAKAYELEINGKRAGQLISIKEALISEKWDVVTIQQASRDSTKFETYTPYIEELVKYVKTYCSSAKIFIHQTWAYEEGSEKLLVLAGYKLAKDMFSDISKAYEKAVKLIKADGIIPSGQAMLNAFTMGGIKMHRDTLHASLGAGRYLLALTWYKALTNNDINDNNFNELAEPITDKERSILIKAVNKAFE